LIGHRLASQAIEHEGKPGLRHLRDRGNFLAANGDVDEHRWRRQIVIPDVVMERLEVPNTLACIRIETHETVGEEVIPVAVAAVEIAGWRLDGQIDVTVLRVRSEWRPHARVAAVLRAPVEPGVVAELTRLGNGVERPLERPGAQVIGANESRDGLFRRRRTACGKRHADDNHVADDHGRRARADR
jgi:hypothetical protein